MEYIRSITTGAIWQVILARPEKRNALNHQMVTELTEAMQAAKEDNQCRAVILKADGAAFCAGADLAYLKQLQKNTFEENLTDSSRLANLFKLMYTFPKLLVTQVEGPALAGGCGLATIGDFCFSTPQSTFGYTEARIGFIPAIVMVFLLRKIGEQRTRELLLSAEIVDAITAQKLNMVYSISEPSEIEQEVMIFTQKMIQRNASASISGIKSMIAHIPELPLDEALLYASNMNAEARATKDCKHGIQSFLDKVKPNWA